MKPLSFFTKRLFRNQQNSSTRVVMLIAYAAIFVSTVVCIVAFSVAGGFKHTLTTKLRFWGGDIQIRSLSMQKDWGEVPMADPDNIISNLVAEIPVIEYCQKFAVKTAVLQTKEGLEGVVVKGISQNRQSGLASFMIAGRVVTAEGANELVMPKVVAEKLGVDVDDYLKISFVDHQEVRPRVMKVVGIFSSSITEVDTLMAYTSLGTIQRINGWHNGEINGLDVFLKEGDTTAIAEEITNFLPNPWVAYTAKELMPQVFNWLAVIHTNAVVVLGLMLIVAAVNLVSAAYVLIIDKTNVIGLLKIFGYSNRILRKIFIYDVLLLMNKYVILGNIVGVAICLVQEKFHIMRLDESSYFVKYVPVTLEVSQFFFITLATEVVVALALYLSSRKIVAVSPAKNINFR